MAPPPAGYRLSGDGEEEGGYHTPRSARTLVKDTRPDANPEEWDLTTVSAMHYDHAWAPHSADIWAAGDASPVHECGSESPNHGSSESDTGVVPTMHGQYGAPVEGAHRSGAAIVKAEQHQLEGNLFHSPSTQVPFLPVSVCIEKTYRDVAVVPFEKL